MLKELPHRTFLEWQEFDRIEPIGGKRGDWQIASLCSLMMNLAAAKAGSTRRVSTRDFLLEWRDASELEKIEAEVKQAEAPAPTTAWQQMKFYARMYAAQANADEKRKQKRKR